MRSASKPPVIALALHPRLKALDDAIEWEELPSLSASLEHRLINPDLGDHGKPRPIVPSVLGGAWDHTMPAELDVTSPSGPFREALQGLSMREVHEPELFRHFFGEGAAKR
ncbi:MAG: hypothetical protein V4739_12390 [Pseudomonadota bacterium]